MATKKSAETPRVTIRGMIDTAIKAIEKSEKSGLYAGYSFRLLMSKEGSTMALTSPRPSIVMKAMYKEMFLPEDVGLRRRFIADYLIACYTIAKMEQKVTYRVCDGRTEFEVLMFPEDEDELFRSYVARGGL